MVTKSSIIILFLAINLVYSEENQCLKGLKLNASDADVELHV